MKIIPKCIKTKRHLCASGSILLPLAQKWGLVGVVICGLSLVGAQSVSAASITLTVPTEKALSLNLTPTASGSFNKSDAANITIKTDALAGYTLSIKAKDGTDLKNTTNPSDTNVISSLGSTTVSENDFKNVANTNYNNKWGFAFGQGTVGVTFRGLTGSAGVEIGKTSEANDTINTYSIVLGARVDNTIATGTYSNTFIVEASANPVPYKVTYSPNASSDQVKNMPSGNSGETDTETFIITEQQPTRIGYRFIGWCDGTTKPETDVDICSDGKSYQPSDPYTLKEKSQNVTLLAMWAKDSQIMQNWKGCETLTEHQTETLVDIRDNNTYEVAKLKDNKCWMVQNLRLGSTLEIGGSPMELDVKTSDISSDGFNLRRTSLNYNANNDYNADAAYIDETYGGYYSWHTATAGTGTTSMGATGENAVDSICPKGWRLPTGGSSSSAYLKNGEFKTLVEAYGGTGTAGSAALRAKPVPDFKIGGHMFNDGKGFVLENQYGAYWSSTTSSANYSYYLGLYTNLADPTRNLIPKSGGVYVRCLVNSSKD